MKSIKYTSGCDCGVFRGQLGSGNCPGSRHHLIIHCRAWLLQKTITTPTDEHNQFCFGWHIFSMSPQCQTMDSSDFWRGLSVVNSRGYSRASSLNGAGFHQDLSCSELLDSFSDYSFLRYTDSWQALLISPAFTHVNNSKLPLILLYKFFGSVHYRTH